MSSECAPPVTIQTLPEEVPSIPSWFAEVVLLARFFSQHGYLAAISEQVRLARGRAGTYEVLDFVAVLRRGILILDGYAPRCRSSSGRNIACCGRELKASGRCSFHRMGVGRSYL